MRMRTITMAYVLLLITSAGTTASAQLSANDVIGKLSELIVNQGSYYQVSGGDDDNNNNYNNDDDNNNNYNNDDNNNNYNNDDNNNDDDHYNNDDNHNNDDDDSNDIPLDGGLSFLALAGVGFGIKKVRDNRMKNKDTNNQQK